MKKVLSLKKLSKRKQREQNARQRVTWQGFSPVTRPPPLSRAYRRSKEKALLRREGF